MKRLKKILKDYIPAIMFLAFIIVSHIFDLQYGKQIEKIFLDYFIELILIVPSLFILVGLFDVWVPKEVIEKHIGEGSGIKGTIFIIIFAMMQAGPLYGAFPVAFILWKKGCSVRNIFIYLSAFSTIRIPMLSFEIGFLGLKFTLVRALVTLPVFILIGVIMSVYLKDKEFKINDVNK